MNIHLLKLYTNNSLQLIQLPSTWRSCDLKQPEASPIRGADRRIPRQPQNMYNTDKDMSRFPKG